MSFDRKAYQRDYQREYYRRRCAEDPEYRKRRQKQQREAKRKKRAADPEGETRRFREWERLRKYGVTQADYDALLLAQGGVCAICRKPPKNDRPLYVDHCHETNVVRGLLCNNCNIALGHLRDDPVLLQSAQLYLAQ